MALHLQRAVPEDPEFRRLLGAVVVVAANAGGAWTPIGDVTTTVSNSRCIYLHSCVCRQQPVQKGVVFVTVRSMLLRTLSTFAHRVSSLRR